jgi:hypothetical protein
VSLDVLQVDGNRSLASQTFWESADAPPPAEAGALSPNERIIELLRPAARWAAIRLVVQSVFPRGARGEEAGLDRLLSGVLYAQSAAGFAGHAEAFRRRAAEELVEAAERLPEAPLPLAALADTLDRLAAASPDRSATLYAQAHQQYARALAAMERQQPPQPALIARYRVREATSWLASGGDEPRHRALERLAGQRLPAEDTAAADLYDAACLYALAAEAADDGAPLRETALGLLARSLAKDRRLAEQARRDPHLLSLRDDVAALAGTPS